jgi:hypothetical protein
MATRCRACGRPIKLINIDMRRGIVGLTMGWVHYSRWANRTHVAIPPEEK